MKDNKSRYTLRVNADLLYKLGYIAEFKGRSKNREIEMLIKRHIARFEEKYGDIKKP